MPFFSFIDQHPSEVPTRRPVDSDEAMTDWIREDRQARHEAVQGRRDAVRRLGAKALVPVVTLALAAGIIHEAAGAAGQAETAAANTAAPIEKAMGEQPHTPVIVRH